MRVVLQKVKSASVKVNEEIVNKIENGIVVLVGIKRDDISSDSDYIVKKCLNLRLWPNDLDTNSHWKLNVKEKDFEVLVISQFTLYGHVNNGSKPDFHNAMNGADALIIFDEMVEKFRNSYKREKIKTGCFGKHMEIDLINDGPVTLIIESDKKSK